jgi:formate hydrogenlyase subunit 4
MKEKLKEFITWCNEQGILIPYVRYKGEPSLSTTLVVASTFFVVMSLIEQLHPYIKVDKEGAFQWAALCYGLAFGHRIASNKGKVTISEKKGNK